MDEASLAEILLASAGTGAARTASAGGTESGEERRGRRGNAGGPVFLGECTGEMDSDIDFMRYALGEAQQALEEGEVPVGAVLVVGGEVVASVHNARESTFDPTAHAEVLALRKAAQALRSWRLNNATLYVTKEPCPMCAGAMVNARLGRLVYGCGDPKGGAVESLYRILSDPRLNHQVEVISGVLGEESAALLKSFFRDRRGGAAFPRKL